MEYRTKDDLYKPHRFKILNSKYPHLVIACFGSKKEAFKECTDWIKSEKNLKGATFKEIDI